MFAGGGRGAAGVRGGGGGGPALAMDNPKEAATEPVRFAIRVGPALDTDGGGLSGGGLLRIGATVPMSGTPNAAIDLVVDMPLIDREVNNAAGQTRVGAWLAGLALAWRLARWSRWSLGVELGGGVAVTRADGEAKAGFVGRQESLASAVGWLAGSASVAIWGRWSARLDAGALVVTPRPVFIVDDAEAATWGGPTARLALSLEASL